VVAKFAEQHSTTPTRMARLFILRLAVLEVQFGKSFKRKRDLGEQAYVYIGQKIMALALSLLN